MSTGEPNTATRAAGSENYKKEYYAVQSQFLKLGQPRPFLFIFKQHFAEKTVGFSRIQTHIVRVKASMLTSRPQPRVWIQLLHYLQITTYFLYWSVPALLNWRPAVGHPMVSFVWSTMSSIEYERYPRKYFFKWAIPGLFFFIFVFSIQLTVGKQLNVRYKSLPMTGFELRTSGVGSDRSTN